MYRFAVQQKNWQNFCGAVEHANQIACAVRRPKFLHRTIFSLNFLPFVRADTRLFRKILNFLQVWASEFEELLVRKMPAVDIWITPSPLTVDVFYGQTLINKAGPSFGINQLILSVQDQFHLSAFRKTGIG